MFGLIKKIFIGLLTDLVNGSNHTKCVLLSNQKCMTQPILINLHPNEYSQEFYYYLFSVKLDRFVSSCNTLNDLSYKVCIPNKAEELNLSIFNMITGINELKTLTKHISCKRKCRFDGKKCNSDQLKKVMHVKKISSCPKVFCEKGFRPATLLKKRLWHRCFPVNFVKFLRTRFLSEHLWWLLLKGYVWNPAICSCENGNI